MVYQFGALQRHGPSLETSDEVDNTPNSISVGQILLQQVFPVVLCNLVRTRASIGLCSAAQQLYRNASGLFFKQWYELLIMSSCQQLRAILRPALRCSVLWGDVSGCAFLRGVLNDTIQQPKVFSCQYSLYTYIDMRATSLRRLCNLWPNPTVLCADLVCRKNASSSHSSNMTHHDAPNADAPDT